jgi:hypothetical protein
MLVSGLAKVQAFLIFLSSSPQAKNAKGYMLLQERNPLCMLPAPLNLFPTLIAPFHYLRIYSAQAEGRELKINETKEAKQQAILMQTISPNVSEESVAHSPQLSPNPKKARQLYVTSIAGSLSDDLIK